MRLSELIEHLNALVAAGASPDLPVFVRIDEDGGWDNAVPLDDVVANGVALVLDGDTDEDDRPGDEMEVDNSVVFWTDELKAAA